MRQTQTVLVVEDEQSIASFVSLYLKNAGYGVRAVGTGAGALNAVAAEMPSLIVLAREERPPPRDVRPPHRRG